MRGFLDLCSGIRCWCCRVVRLSLRTRARLIAVVVVLSLLVAAMPGVTGYSQGKVAVRRAALRESLPSEVYRGVRNVFAAIGNWFAASLTSAGPVESSYQPVVAFITPPPFLDAPTNLSVSAVSDTTITLGWTAPAGSVSHYQVERSQSIAGPFVFRANSASTTFQDSASTDQAYLYRVRAVTSGGLSSAPSNMALATAISFEFSGVPQLQNKEVKKQHFYDIRTAINAVRAVAGLTAASWARGDLTGLEIKADDVQEMRNKLTEALTVLDIPILGYEDAVLQTGAMGTLIKAIHIDQLQVRSTRGNSNSSGPVDADSSTAQLDPLNETGGGGDNPLSRNFNWNLPLVALTGRAEMDLELSLSYNSLVWTRAGNTISFNRDNGFPGPGFRLGFPVIRQSPYVNSEVGKTAYQMIGADGSHRELRQVSTSGPGANLYEAADSSHMLLDTSTNPFKLRTSDGTQFTYALHGGDYQCTKITDRNGNYISINYTAAGRIDAVIDTLGRSIDFVYDAQGWLTEIKQLVNGSTPHYWARFSYSDTTFDTDFGTLTVLGPADLQQSKTLSKVTLPDDSYFQFTYNTWGQVSEITKFDVDDNPIVYRSYNLPADDSLEHDDCPRFTIRKDWAKYWNGDTDGTIDDGEKAATNFIIPENDDWTMPDGTPKSGVRAQITTPDGTINKIYFIGIAGTQSGWRRGLPILVDTITGTTTHRRVATTWTQDDINVPYPLNPRVLETNIHDASNRARTQIEYQQATFANGTSCWLPRDVFEYEADASTILRTTRTNYNTDTAYSSRRIIGLPSEKLLYEGNVNAPNPVLKTKVQFVYDELAGFDGTEAPTVQHDSAYAAHFVGRANLTKVIRHNVSASESTSTSSKYNRAGAVISTKDASDHETLISYADSFADDNNRGTFAYPKTVTDPDGFTFTFKYNFDFGGMTYRRTPEPNNTVNSTDGPEQTFAFDNIGRLQQVTNVANGSYTRFVYTSQLRVDIYSTIQDGLGEAHSFRITDGAERVIATARPHPGSDGGFSVQRTVYDVMGRVFKTSNPTESDVDGESPLTWAPTGDDANWLYTEQTYDWKGRPLRTTHPNTAYSEAAYSGCGCAGGEVVTLTDEGSFDTGTSQFKRRQRKIYSDVLGRTVKTEILNWQGGSVYSATVNTYNVRDQIETITVYPGPEGTGTPQVTSMTYDGYGRLSSKKLPEQSASTTWTYNADDTINSVTDARSASQTFAYNGRHLVTGKTYAAPGGQGIVIPASVTYTYDAAGNRKKMTDGFGDHNYVYDQLSRLTQESRQFSVGTYSIGYSYNLAGQLIGMTDPTGASFTYTRDIQGQLKSLTGSAYGGTTNYINNVNYRAWGKPKSITYPGYTATITYTQRMQPFQYRGAIREDYGYFADGRIASITDLDDTAGSNPPVSLRFLSRDYRYDHVGRVTSSFGTGSGNSGIPYSQSYAYDHFGNITTRSGKYYNYNSSGPNTDTATFVNNRRSNWSYNAEGRVTSTPASSTDSPRTMSYDAANGLRTSVETGPFNTKTYAAGYDGDARVVHEISTTTPGGSQGSYIIRSTVLDGEVLTRLDGSGNKLTTHVPAEGLIFATQRSSGGPGPFVMFTERSPVGLSETSKAVYDPLGNYIPFTPHGDPRPPVGSYNSASMGGLSANTADPDSLGVGCVLDGIPVDCNRAMQTVNNGSIHPTEIMIRSGSIVPFLLRLMLDMEYRRIQGEMRGTVNYRFLKNFLPGAQFSFEPNEEETAPQTPCHIMADVAQAIATDAVRLTNNPQDALKEFDRQFSVLYHGPPMTSVANMEESRRLNYRGKSGRSIPARYVGSEGFLPKYKDSEAPHEDQTHHFSAHMSLGINRRMYVNAFRNFVDNAGDDALGEKAYAIGRMLKGGADRGNVGGLNVIGEYIKRNICTDRGRGLSPGQWGSIQLAIIKGERTQDE